MTSVISLPSACPVHPPFTPEAGFSLQRARDTTAFLVYPTGTTTTENGVCADYLETHTTGVFTRLLKHIEPGPRYQDLGFAMLTRSTIPSMLVFPRISLSCSSFSDDDQVICIQVFPGTVDLSYVRCSTLSSIFYISFLIVQTLSMLYTRNPD